MKIEPLEIKIHGELVRSTLYLPEGEFQKMVIFCHGFPGTNRLPGLRHALIQQNIALVEADYRGDGWRCGKFSFRGSISDIVALCVELNFRFSETKKCLLGYSAGGLYVANLLQKYGPLVDSVVLLNPALDPWIFSDQTLMQTLWPIAQERLFLHEPDFYKKEVSQLPVDYNPFHFVGELPLPVTIVHSENDEVVSIDTSKEFCRKWPATNFVVMKGKTHDLVGNEKELLETLINSAL